ncbi:site-specific integrase [Pseudomonas sp. CIP-10]|uniref:site-specific integrase n=2 Tax=Pseudomonas TaxID=286 RepID=UPI001E51ABD1|nr:site-specific integrase [Pseudomonas sp. CIP-10]UFH30048.1 site-specific integrase [Pseudomonas sp. CIP-10]
MELRIDSHDSERYATKSGCVFTVDSTVWQLNRNVKLDFSRLVGLVSDEVLSAFKVVMSYYARDNTPAYALNIFERYLYLAQFAAGRELTVDLLINYRISLNGRDWYFNFLKSLFVRWNKLGVGAVSVSVVEYFKAMKSFGNPRGDAVKRRDPIKGPFSDIELEGLYEVLIQGYEFGAINLEAFALTLITLALGSRPIQITDLRGVDLILEKDKAGEPQFVLMVPRAKQQGGAFRQFKKRRLLPADVWQVLSAQKKYVIERIRSMCSEPIPEDLLEEIPLFPNWSKFHEGMSIASLSEGLASDVFHMTGSLMTIRIKNAVSILKVQSERTGKALTVCPRRFRYTVATRAAREGYGPLVIAELLDHNDLQNVTVYTENVPEYGAKISAVLDPMLVSYAKAFAGVLVTSKANALRGDDNSATIRTPDGQPSGTCGFLGFCTASVPIPCYTCAHFQPWLNGPHQAVYDYLLSERARLIDLTGDAAVATSLDRGILAVAEVVALCKARQEQIPEFQNQNIVSEHKLVTSSLGEKKP